MAIHTGDVFRSMDGGFECSWFDRDGNRLSTDLSGHTFLLMACQTGFVGGLISLGWRGCFDRCCSENNDHKEKEHSQRYAS
jgi:hypothetical protein